MGDELTLKRLFEKYVDINLAEAAYLTLRDGIQQGVLQGGNKLSEVELAQMFQVSRTPIQKALIRLECDYLIKYEPKCGYVVEQMDFKNCVDYNEYSLLMYTASVILAVRRRISDYYEMVLRKKLREMEDVQDITVYLSMVDNFHYQIATSAHNEEFTKAFRRMTTRGCIMGLLYARRIPLDERAFIAEHNSLIQRVFDLICCGSLNEAVCFMETEYCPHLRNLVTQWCQEITED